MTLTLDIGDSGADLSPCGRYRYSLWRRWDYDKPSVLFVMLNPSTADADVDDNTIRKCMGFARRWNAGAITVCNLYPWRATNPADLPRGTEVFGAAPLGHELNARAISHAASEAQRIIVAWGGNPGPWKSQPRVVLGLLAGHDVEALKLTKHGHPWHPLYVPYSAEPVVYSEPQIVTAT